MKFFNQAPPQAKWTQQWSQSPQGQYTGFSRDYQTSATVFACIEMLATSVGEPMMVGRKWQRNSPQIRNQLRVAKAGEPYRVVNKMAIQNGFYRDITDHPCINLLHNPNPWISHDELWGNVILDRAVAGNAYLLKGRYQNGLLKGKPAELWRLRPDRVKVVPGGGFIAGYEYNIGSDKVFYPAEDILHFKTRNPLNDFYGQPTLQALADDIAIGQSMKKFLKNFFERGGASGPGGILSVKQKVSQEAKDEIRDRYRARFGAAPGELMVLDNAESEYQKMGLDRGLRDALPKEISDGIDAMIAMEFGIPASILGIPIGMESSSYANKRSDWQTLWDMTMAPLLSSLAGEITRNLVPDFGGIDEVAFDVSDIKALQEDVDLIHKRWRDDLAAGIASWEEAREGVGLNPKPSEGIFFVASNFVPTEVDILGEPPPLPAAPKQIAAPSNLVDEVRHECTDGRRRLIAREVEGNPELWCEDCKMRFRPHDTTPAMTVKTVEYGDDGKVARVLEVVS